MTIQSPLLPLQLQASNHSHVCIRPFNSNYLNTEADLVLLSQWASRAVVLNFPNVEILSHSSSGCGDHQPYNYFPCYFLTVILLLLWTVMQTHVFSDGLKWLLWKGHLAPNGVATYRLKTTVLYPQVRELSIWSKREMKVWREKDFPILSSFLLHPLPLSFRLLLLFFPFLFFFHFFSPFTVLIFHLAP